jgi:hypothetical protein
VHMATRLRRGDGPYVAPPAPETALRFPGEVVALPGGTFLVSDTAHHQLVELEPDLVTERAADRVTGERGSRRRRDGGGRGSPSRRGCSGPPRRRRRAGRRRGEPRGAPGRPGRRRGVDGGGHGRAAARRGWPSARASAELSTPWDLAWWGGTRRRRDGRQRTSCGSLDPATGEARVLAGHHRRGTARRTAVRRGVLRPAVGPGRRRRRRRCGSPTPRPPRCGRVTATARRRRGGERRPSGSGCSSPGTATATAASGAAAAPARGGGAARRVGRRRRHLQRGGAPVRPRDEPCGLDAGTRPAPSRRTCWSTARPWWSWSRRRTGWCGCRSRRVARVDGGADRVVARPATDLAPGGAGAARSTSCRRPVSTWTHRFGDPTSLTVAAVPPELLLSGVAAPRPG